MIQSSNNGNPLLPYTQTQLPGGFTLVHKRVSSAPIVALDFWIHTGAIHDPEPHYGLSHFYEHMFFKGTERHGVGVMDRIITSLGGYNNAATSLDYTHYYVALPSAGWRAALDVLLDSLLNPLFDPKEIEREREVITEEIKRHEDNPWSKIYDDFISASFADNNYNRKVLGTVESLHTIDHDVFRDYQQRRYHPENITLCAVGDLDGDELQEVLANHLEGIPFPPFKDIQIDWPIISSGNETAVQRDVNQSYLLIGFPMTRVLGTPDEYALDLLSTMIGEGRSSRLHRRLIDELGLVSSISCSSWSLKHAGLFLMEAVTEEDKLEQVEQEINAELQRIREDITEDELRKVKNMERADYPFSNEKAVSIAQTFGYSRMAINIDHAVNYVDRMEAVTIDDVYRAYDAHLQPGRRCKGVLLPKRG
ncbi:MAG: pitrilysin family protein [Candidatus Hinthialibacter antarcticus]|nr:pitrilysin family protein [Candidatus Hinthialibacter antarcticus]